MQYPSYPTFSMSSLKQLVSNNTIYRRLLTSSLVFNNNDVNKLLLSILYALCEIKITQHSFAVSILIDGKVTLLPMTCAKKISRHFNSLDNVKFFIEQDSEFIAILQDNTVDVKSSALEQHYVSWLDFNVRLKNTKTMLSLPAYINFLTLRLKNIQGIQKITIFCDYYVVISQVAGSYV